MSLFHEASTPVSAKQIASAGGIVLTNVPCDLSVFIGAAVRMDVLGVAYNANALTAATANLIGIVQAKSSGTLCDIRVTGVSPDILIGLDVTKEYFLSETVDGEITTIVPITSGSIIVRVGQPFSELRLLVNKGTPVRRG